MREASGNESAIGHFDKGKELTVNQNKVLEKDIRKLQDKIGVALDYYLELHQRYGDQPGWEMVEDKLVVAMGWAESPLDPVFFFKTKNLKGANK